MPLLSRVILYQLAGLTLHVGVAASAQGTHASASEQAAVQLETALPAPEGAIDSRNAQSGSVAADQQVAAPAAGMPMLRSELHSGTVAQCINKPQALMSATGPSKPNRRSSRLQAKASAPSIATCVASLLEPALTLTGDACSLMCCNFFL